MIAVFSKDGCELCEEVKATLEEKSIEYEEVNVTNDNYYLAHLRAAGAEVPRIWDGTTFVGGYPELNTYLLRKGCDL